MRNNHQLSKGFSLAISTSFQKLVIDVYFYKELVFNSRNVCMRGRINFKINTRNKKANIIMHINRLV